MTLYWDDLQISEGREQIKIGYDNIGLKSILRNLRDLKKGAFLKESVDSGVENGLSFRLTCNALTSVILRKITDERSNKRSTRSLSMLLKVVYRFLNLKEKYFVNDDDRKVFLVGSNVLIRRILKNDFKLVHLALKSNSATLVCNAFKVLAVIASRGSRNCEEVWKKINLGPILYKTIFKKNDTNKVKRGNDELISSYLLLFSTLLKCKTNGLRNFILGSQKTWGWPYVTQKFKEVKNKVLKHTLEILKDCSIDGRIEHVNKTKFYTLSLMKEVLGLLENENRYYSQEAYDLVTILCCTNPRSGIFSEYAEQTGNENKNNYSKTHKKLCLILKLLKPISGGRKQDLIVNICTYHPGLISEYFSLHDSLISNLHPGLNDSWLNFSSLVSRITMIDTDVKSLFKNAIIPCSNRLISLNLPTQISKSLLLSALLHKEEAVKYSTTVIICYVFQKFRSILERISNIMDECSYNFKIKGLNDQVLRNIEEYVSLLSARLPDFQVVLSQLIAQNKIQNIEIANKNNFDISHPYGVPKNLQVALFRITKYYLMYLPLKLDAIRFDFKKLYIASLPSLGNDVLCELLDIVIITSSSAKWHVKPTHINTSILQELLLIYIFQYSKLHLNPSKILTTLTAVLRNSPTFENRDFELDLFLNLLKNLRCIPPTHADTLISWLNTALFVSFAQPHPSRYSPGHTNVSRCSYDSIVHFVGNSLGSILKKWYCSSKKELDAPFIFAITAWASNYYCLLTTFKLTSKLCVESIIDTIKMKYLPDSGTHNDINVINQCLYKAVGRVENINKSKRGNTHKLNFKSKNLLTMVFNESINDFMDVFPDLVHLISKDAGVRTYIKDFIFIRHPLEGSIFVKLLSVYGEFNSWPETARDLVLCDIDDNMVFANIYIAIDPDNNRVLNMLNEVVDYVISIKKNILHFRSIFCTIKNILAICVKSSGVHQHIVQFFIGVLERLVERVKTVNLDDYDFISILINDDSLTKFALVHLNTSSTTNHINVACISLRYAKTLARLICFALKMGAPKTMFEKYIQEYGHLLSQVFGLKSGTQAVNSGHIGSETFKINEILSVAIYLGLEDILNVAIPNISGRELISLLEDPEIMKTGTLSTLDVGDLTIRELLELNNEKALISVINAWFSNYKLRCRDDNKIRGILDTPDITSSSQSLLKLRIICTEDLKFIEKNKKHTFKWRIPCKLRFADDKKISIISSFIRNRNLKAISAIINCGIAFREDVYGILLNNENFRADPDYTIKILACTMMTPLDNVHISEEIQFYLSSCLRSCLGYYTEEIAEICTNECADHVKLLISRFPYVIAKNIIKRLDDNRILRVLSVSQMRKFIPCLVYYYPILSEAFIREKDFEKQLSLDFYTLGVINSIFEVNNEEFSTMQNFTSDLIMAVCKRFKSPCTLDTDWVKSLAFEFIKDPHVYLFQTLFRNLLEHGHGHIMFLELISHLYFWIFRTVPEVVTNNRTLIDVFNPFTAVKLVVDSDSFAVAMRDLKDPPEINNERSNYYEEVMTYMLDALNHATSLCNYDVLDVINLNDILKLYNATKKPLEKKIFSLLYTIEVNTKVSVYKFIRNWNDIQNRGYDYYIKNIDSTVMLHTIEFFDSWYDLEYCDKNTPLDRNLYRECLLKCYSKHKSHSQSPLYDPSFLIPLATAIIQSCDSKHIRNHLELIQKSNILGLAVMCCSSLSSTTREIGFFFLNLFVHRLNDCKNTLDLAQTKLVLNCLKNSIDTNKERVSEERLPSPTAFFIAQSLAFITKPDNFMYKPLNKFFLGRPLIELNKPDILKEIFNSTHESARQQRLWLLHILSRGLACTEDYEYYMKGDLINILISACNSPFSDAPIKKLILSLFIEASKLRIPIEGLLSDTSLVSFIEREFVNGLSCNHYTIDLRTIYNYSNILMNLSKNFVTYKIEGDNSTHPLEQAITSCNKAIYYFLCGLNEKLRKKVICEGMEIILNVVKSMAESVYALKFPSKRKVMMYDVILFIEISSLLETLFEEHVRTLEMKLELKNTYHKVKESILNIVFLAKIPKKQFLGTFDYSGKDYSVSYFSRFMNYVIDSIEAFNNSNLLEKRHCLSCSGWLEDAMSEIENVINESNLALLSKLSKDLPKLMEFVLRMEVSGFAPLYDRLSSLVSRVCLLES